jgi:hypothetical protein
MIILILFQRYPKEIMNRQKEGQYKDPNIPEPGQFDKFDNNWSNGQLKVESAGDSLFYPVIGD